MTWMAKQLSRGTILAVEKIPPTGIILVLFVEEKLNQTNKLIVTQY